MNDPPIGNEVVPAAAGVISDTDNAVDEPGQAEQHNEDEERKANNHPPSSVRQDGATNEDDNLRESNEGDQEVYEQQGTSVPWHPPLAGSSVASLPPPPPPVAHAHSNALAMAHYYEAQMRDHAAAYANAAAGAAWAAAQIAAAAADFANSTTATTVTSNLSDHPPLPPPPHSNAIPPWFPSTAGGGPPFPPGPGIPTSLPPRSLGYPPPNESMPYYGPFPSPPQQQHHQYYSPLTYAETFDSDYMEDNLQEDYEPDKARSRRKRLERPQSDDSSVPRIVSHRKQAPPHQNQQNNKPSFWQTIAATTTNNSPASKQRGKIRRRLRSDGDSSTTSSGSSLWNNSAFHGYNNPNSHGHGHGHHNHHRQRSSVTRNKKKARSDETLLGKTAVAALFEWCAKRQKTPILECSDKGDDNDDDEEFYCRVILEDDPSDNEIGRGKGRTKLAARHAAAREALRNLVPGVVFDSATGILLDLPSTTATNSMLTINSATVKPTPPTATNPRSQSCPSSSLEDLAPNLAKRLAIGHDNDREGVAVAASASRGGSQAKRSLNVYPGTSTTASEEEAEDNQDAYYTSSKGASVCSVLLHAMVQINPRIRAPPVYRFAAAPLPGMAHLRRKVDSDTQTSAVRVVRGPFTCTASLKLSPKLTADNEKTEGEVVEKNEEDSSCDSKPAASSPPVETLEATGIGGTKREAKHVASAKLLALLFPECETMVEVKAAAEAAREAFAAAKAKALKQSRKYRSIPSRSRSGWKRRQHPRHSYGSITHVAMARSEDPALPNEFQQELLSLAGLETKEVSKKSAIECDPNAVGIHDTQTAGAVSRATSRRRQLDAQVELALQTLNERDEEGRSLPEELTVDDVGRTILRQALPGEDLTRLSLFEESQNAPQLDRHLRLLPSSSLSIVLLLCRAIGAYEDPPLGCAILSPSFSMERGRTLNVVQIASEGHLPMERFVECLQDFAKAMKYELIVGKVQQRKNPTNYLTVRTEDLEKVVASHVHLTEYSSSLSITNRGNSDSGPEKEDSGDMSRIGSSRLQAVAEESECSESSVEKLTKLSNHASKRSRVA